MTMLHKLFMALLLITVIGVVGCADQKSPADKTGKSPEAANTGENGDHNHEGEEATSVEGTTPTEPAGDGPEIPVPSETPDVDASENGDTGAQSGSSEKKGGVNVPE